MNWQQAVEILANGNPPGYESEPFDQAVEFITNAISDPTGKGDYEGNPVGSKGALQDWIAEGDWNGLETLADIQAEWDES